jgi:hypothetical protein
MTAKIYKPAKNAMQSGNTKTNFWLLEYTPEGKKFIDPLMGWSGGTDTKGQLKLKFPTKEKAIAYATSNGIAYILAEPKARKKVKKSYADNFAYRVHN